MKKRLFTLTILLLIVFFGLLAYEYRSPLYNKVMGSSYRPILERDIRDLQANIHIVKGHFDLSCHNEYYMEELTYIEEGLSKLPFGLVRDLTPTKKEVLVIQQELIDQLKLCQKESLPETRTNITLTLSGKVSTRTFNLTGRNLTNEYLTIENIGPVPIQPHIIINGKDWSSLQSILQSTLTEGMTNHQKAVAIWEFVRGARYHFQKPFSSSYPVTPLTLFNSWGYANCGEASRAVIGLSRLAGFEVREVRLNQHIVAEIFYDNGWHMLDADGEVLFLDQGGDILSVEEIRSQPGLLIQVQSGVYPLEYFIKAYTGKRGPAIFNPIIDDTPFIYTLRSGESVLFQRGNEGDFFSGENYTLPPDFSNGYFIYKTIVHDGEIIIFNYPYPLVGGQVQGSFESVYFSTDRWRWTELAAPDFSGLFNNGQGIPDHSYFLKFKGEGEATITTKVQMATRSLPLLEPSVFNQFRFIDRQQQPTALVKVTLGFRE